MSLCIYKSIQCVNQSVVNVQYIHTDWLDNNVFTKAVNNSTPFIKGC